MDIQNIEGLQYLQKTVKNKSIDLILTDPPYKISKETGMDNLHKMIEENKEKGITSVKTEQEWEQVKDKYIGSKYSVQTQYGDWDENFTLETLDQFVQEFYKKLRIGGTVIIFFDFKKITYLFDILEKHKFKQPRLIEWIKTNPQPINSKINYLNRKKRWLISAFCWL